MELNILSSESTDTVYLNKKARQQRSLFSMGDTSRVTAEDTYSFIESKNNSSTKKKTDSDVKRFKDWLGREDQELNFEEMPPSQRSLT
ncbi:hypothetical protein DPMN_039814 [Dreissena polymorpha]|uniref:Uncharacterized protein n=1 Tax=Dreissena polymorpha TaxID=45954 RepID=A0A9D4HUQ5_DREPO|nr:hypothetical protein DPMN_039814 [Dreissena polymorpha]